MGARVDGRLMVLTDDSLGVCPVLGWVGTLPLMRAVSQHRWRQCAGGHVAVCRRAGRRASRRAGDMAGDLFAQRTALSGHRGSKPLG